jgi:ADP-heptose:LPS heptosyltransferase
MTEPEPPPNLVDSRRGSPARASHGHEPVTTAAPPLRPVVFFFCRLGDMVMLTAMLHRLHRRYRLPSYVIGAGSWNDSVYQENPDVAGLWSFRRHFPFVLNRAWGPVRRLLRETHPGPIYVCEKHYRQLPRIRRMLALSGVDPRRCVFITDDAADAPRHLIDRLMRLGSRTPPLLRESDYPLPREMDGPRLYISASERAERDAWLAAQGWAGRDLVLIQPGNHRTMSWRRGRWRRTNADNKAWPQERWAALLQKIHARMPHAQIVLRGAREEVPMLREIQAATGLESVGVAGDTLREFFALCEAAHSMISVDSGPAHAAAALSVPLVVLYGAESPLNWLPRSPTGSPVVGVVGRPPATRADQIPVEAVFDAWCSVLAQMSAADSAAPAHAPEAAGRSGSVADRAANQA